MYEIFNLNYYLRSFVRKDFTDEYEASCLKIVQKYKGQETIDCFNEMIEEFNEQLAIMAAKVIEEKKSEWNCNFMQKGVSMNASNSFGTMDM